ncbi:5-oxoprolinase subunit PxpA [Algibacter luteus]|uniref:5-oxoprolinase subunit PxpA n=1 Tax=Algibacter luteus TaxID=1178825 RepID=UPI002591AA30|nr:5-oxoprolinase subunit PxpA [Algibacter luteus]WJJ95254.1 5-oxoprolinase subunit PxpA [Algibacter luteus]
MKNLVLDINADIGEGIGNEHLIMPYISSCNIACGGHAGDEATMKEVVLLAKKHQVKIGAHPSFPDKVNFGRKIMNMPCVTLYASIKTQIKSLLAILNEAHLPLHHVKLHGALYNQAAIDNKTANTVIEVMKSLMLPAKLYVPYNSVIAKLAIEQDIPIMYEAFADRNYNDDLTLVSRDEPNALIEDSDKMFNHVFEMFSTKKVKTVTGNYKTIKAETFCVHGDHPNAPKLIKNLSVRLAEKGIKVR